MYIIHVIINILYLCPHSYNAKLKEAQTTNTLKGLTVGVNFGVIYFLIFVCYAVAFW